MLHDPPVRGCAVLSNFTLCVIFRLQPSRGLFALHGRRPYSFIFFYIKIKRIRDLCLRSSVPLADWSPPSTILSPSYARRRGTPLTLGRGYCDKIGLFAFPFNLFQPIRSFEVGMMICHVFKLMVLFKFIVLLQPLPFKWWLEGGRGARFVSKWSLNIIMNECGSSSRFKAD